MTTMKVRRAKRVFSTITLASILLLLGHSAAVAQTKTSPESQSIPTDAPVEVEVIGDKHISYKVELKPGEFFQVRVEQRDSEILLRLLDAADSEVARMSSPKEKEGLE